MSTSPPSPRIAIAGSVISTRRTLQALLRHRAPVVGVLGLDAARAERVSGYARLDDLAADADVPYRDFKRINDEAIVETVRDWAPDLLFVVGLSQLVRPDLLAVPTRGCVGFHPTWLPKGRGRAPLAWLTLRAESGAATFFLMDKGADSGPVLAQEPFPVYGGDYAIDVLARLEDAMDRALNRWLPSLLDGVWDPQPQDEARATYYGRRIPEDGHIDWSAPAEEVLALVRAASHPHPGAYTYHDGERLVVWRAEQADLPDVGVVGRVLRTDDGVVVQTGDGLVRLTDIENGVSEAPAIRVGTRLGYAVEDEVHALRRRVAALEARLDAS